MVVMATGVLQQVSVLLNTERIGKSTNAADAWRVRRVWHSLWRAGRGGIGRQAEVLCRHS
jgi:hypothetical protein